MFRHLDCSKRQSSKSQFRAYVWLGNIRRIVLSIQQIFVIPKMQFSISFSALRDMEDWVAANCFWLKTQISLNFKILFTEIPAYPFPIYIYISPIMGSLLISFTIFASFFFVIAQLLSLIIIVVLHHNFQVNILHYPSLKLLY